MKSYLAAALLLSSIGCSHKMAVLPRQGWMLHERAVTANSLSATVVDPSGARRAGVLVQMLTPDKKHRTASQQTDESGRFRFRSKANQTCILRFSSQEGFDDIELSVAISPQAPPLRVELIPSN